MRPNLPKPKPNLKPGPKPKPKPAPKPNPSSTLPHLRPAFRSEAAQPQRPTPTPTLPLTLTLPCPGFRTEFAARTNIVRKPGATDVTKTVRMLPGRCLK